MCFTIICYNRVCSNTTAVYNKCLTLIRGNSTTKAESRQLNVIKTQRKSKLKKREEVNTKSYKQIEVRSKSK